MAKKLTEFQKHKLTEIENLLVYIYNTSYIKVKLIKIKNYDNNKLVISFFCTEMNDILILLLYLNNRTQKEYDSELILKYFYNCDNRNYKVSITVYDYI